MTQGHIKISRSIIDWRWFDDAVMLSFWLHLLLMANWKDKEWHNKTIKRGSFVTTVASLSTQLNLSVKQVRTCLDRLRAGGEITTNTSNNYTLISICKYDSYQCQPANEGQMFGKSADNPGATTKEEYNTTDTNVSLYSIQEDKNKKKEKDTDVSFKKEPTDISFVLDLWNSYAKRNVPKVRSLTQARKEKVKLRIKEMGGIEKAKETLTTCFKKISESDFCTGANGEWAANFDWFFRNEEIWLKVLEGNYDNRTPKSQLEILAENIAKADAYYEQRYRSYGGASAYGVPSSGGSDGPDEQ